MTASADDVLNKVITSLQGLLLCHNYVTRRKVLSKSGSELKS